MTKGDYVSKWELYHRLIEGIDENLVVKDCVIGANWTIVQTDENTGVALTVKETSRPRQNNKPIIGMPLKEAAELSMSWNFLEASVGMAAINAFYNKRELAEQMPGYVSDRLEKGTMEERNKDSAFAAFKEEVTGKKVAVIGHFPHIEKRYAPYCELSVLERFTSPGDFPDSACEYILPEQDYVFITGMTFMNKTLPRLLEICRPDTQVSLVGPSAPLSNVLFDFNVDNISGYLALEHQPLKECVSIGGRMCIYEYGQKVSIYK